jgi:TPR repeat protein
MIHLRKVLVMVLISIVFGQITGAQSDAILQRFLPKATAGDAQAQYIVGSRYYQLHDINNAKLWLQKSAAQGNQQAAGFLSSFLGAGAPAPVSSAAPPAGMALPGNAAMAGAAGLCPGSGRSLEKNGIVSVLQQALKQMVGEAGLEPTTPGLEGRCSIQLSYSPVSAIVSSPGAAPKLREHP